MPRPVARRRVSILPLGAGAALAAFGLYLFLTRSADEDGVRGRFGLGLVGCGIFLLIVFALGLVLERRPSRDPRP